MNNVNSLSQDENFIDALEQHYKTPNLPQNRLSDDKCKELWQKASDSFKSLKDDEKFKLLKIIKLNPESLRYLPCNFVFITNHRDLTSANTLALMANSPVFYHLFNSTHLEAPKNIDVENADAFNIIKLYLEGKEILSLGNLGRIKNVLYLAHSWQLHDFLRKFSEKCILTENNVWEIHNLSKKLNIRTLEMKCLSYLFKDFTLESVTEFYQFALDENDENLKKACELFFLIKIKENLNNLYDKDFFEAIDPFLEFIPNASFAPLFSSANLEQKKDLLTLFPSKFPVIDLEQQGLDGQILKLVSNSGYVRSINLANAHKWNSTSSLKCSGEDWSDLRQLKDIESLNFTGCYSALEHLPYMLNKNLKELWMGGLFSTEKVEDGQKKFILSCLEQIAEQCSELELLDISHLDLDDEALRILYDKAVSKSLTTLSLANNAALSSEALSEIGEKFPSLTKLDLRGVSNLSTDDLIKIVQSLPKLEELNISSCREITNDALAFIAKVCQNLQALNLERCGLIGDDGVSSLKECVNLTELRLYGSSISGKGIRELFTKDESKEKEPETKDNDQDTKSTMNLKHLTHSYDICENDPTLLREIAKQWKELITWEIRSVREGPSFKELNPALENLRNLRSFALFINNSNQNVLETIVRHCPKLTSLECIGESDFSMSKALLSELAKLTNLKKLVLVDANALSKNYAELFNSLSKLESLTLSKKNLSNKLFGTIITRIPQIKELELNLKAEYLELTPIVWKKIAELKHLRYVDLVGHPPSEEIIVEMFSNNPSLKRFETSMLWLNDGVTSYEFYRTLEGDVKCKVKLVTINNLPDDELEREIRRKYSKIPMIFY